MKKAKRILMISIGTIFILVGLAGLVLPFLQGFLFLFIGIFLLSFYFPKTRFWINKHTEKYPHLDKIVKSIEKWMAKILGEI